MHTDIKILFSGHLVIERVWIHETNYMQMSLIYAIFSLRLAKTG